MSKFSRLPRGRIALAVGLVAATGVPSSDAFGQIASAKIREGDTLAGGATVSTVRGPAANGIGGYVFSVGSSDTLDRFVGNAIGAGPAAILLTEGTYGPYVQSAYEGFFGFSNSGLVANSPTVADTSSGQTGLDCVWLGTTKLFNERDQLPVLDRYVVFASDPNVTHAGSPYWISGYTATLGGSTQARGLFYGTLGTPLIRTGDTIAGAETAVSTDGPQFGSRVSGAGTRYIARVDFDGPTASDLAIVADNAVLQAGGSPVREGTVVPTSIGGNGVETWSAFDAVGINERGDTLVTGNTNGAAATNEFVLYNGRIALREGSTIPTTIGPGVLSGDIEWGALNENGDWAVTWDVNANGANREALVVNGVAVLVEGDRVDFDGDGALDTTSRLVDFTGSRALGITDRTNVGGLLSFNIAFSAAVDFNGTTSTTDDRDAGFVQRVVVRDLPGDYNGDGFVDAADYTVWADGFGQSFPAADGNRDGIVDAADYTIWADRFGQGTPPTSFGAVPEPGAAATVLVAAAGLTRRRR